MREIEKKAQGVLEKLDELIGKYPEIQYIFAIGESTYWDVAEGKKENMVTTEYLFVHVGSKKNLITLTQLLQSKIDEMER